MIIRHEPPRDTTCLRKKAYTTIRKSVSIGLKSMARRPETPLYLYVCDQCKLYHLTSHPRRGAVAVAQIASSEGWAT